MSYLNRMGLGSREQVSFIFNGFFPDYQVGRWHQVDRVLYTEARLDLESKTKFLLENGADPQKLLDIYRQIANSDVVTENNNFWVLCKAIERFYDKAIDYLGEDLLSFWVNV